VKFQTHRYQDEQLNIKVTSPHFKAKDRYAWVKFNTEITPYDKFWKPLKKYCDQIGIDFFSTPMSRGAAVILNKLGIELWKVGSGDILDFVMLDYIAQTKKPLIISCGMSTLEETDLMVNFLKIRKVDFTLMHCVSRYPCPPRDLNLATIEFLKKRCRVPIGFSDHSLSIDSVLSAVSLGACVIEKHFSVSRDMWGSDHKTSLTPHEFRRLANSIRNLEQGKMRLAKKTVNKFYGKEGKHLQDKETVFRSFFRKSLIAGQPINIGTIIKPAMIFAMRPQAFVKGIPSEDYEKLLGRVTVKKIKKYEPFTWNLFKI